MRDRDEQLEEIAATLKDQYLGEQVAELWDEVNEDGSGLEGDELATIIRSGRSKVGRALALLQLIEGRLERAARERASEQAEEVLREQQASRRPRNRRASEDAGDLS